MVTSNATADPRPLRGYGALVATYGSLSLGLAVALRKRGRSVRALTPMDLVLLGLATEHLSRLITKDSVTAVLRSPFTKFEEPAGAGEVNEEVIGTGLRHAAGELVTCPFCVAQWVATGLVAGQVAFPRVTTAAINICAAARVSDFLQLLYGLARSAQ